MPHFSFEYSANIEQEVDISLLCNLLRQEGLKTGIFPLAGIRVRAICCHHYSIADGSPDHAFIDISVRLRGGRSIEARKKATAEIFAAVEAHLESVLTSRPLALSFEMRNIDPELSPKQNSIRNFIAGGS